MTTAVAETGQEQLSSAAPQTVPLAQAYPAPGGVARFFGNTWAITKKELNVYFTTPLAYVLFAVFITILSIVFRASIPGFIRMQQQQMMMAQFGQGQEIALNFTDHIFLPIINLASTLMLFIMPFITMRLLAEERRQQTFQLLLTTPVRSSEIVLGKFFASQFVVSFAILLTAIYPLMLNSFATDGKVELQTALVAYLGLMVLNAALMAIGLFISSLTESQVVAAAISFGVALGLWFMSFAARVVDGDKAKQLLAFASPLSHLEKFFTGRIAVVDLAYFLSLTILGLVLTRASIERSRW